MNGKSIYMAMGLIDHDLVQEAELVRLRKSPWRRVGELAAALALVLGLPAVGWFLAGMRYGVMQPTADPETVGAAVHWPSAVMNLVTAALGMTSILFPLLSAKEKMNKRRRDLVVFTSLALAMLALLTRMGLLYWISDDRDWFRLGVSVNISPYGEAMFLLPSMALCSAYLPEDRGERVMSSSKLKLFACSVAMGSAAVSAVIYWQNPLYLPALMFAVVQMLASACALWCRITKRFPRAEFRVFGVMLVVQIITVLDQVRLRNTGLAILYLASAFVIQHTLLRCASDLKLREEDHNGDS